MVPGAASCSSIFDMAVLSPGLLFINGHISISEGTMREDFVEEQRTANCSFLNKPKLFVPIEVLGEVLWQKK